MRRSLLIVLAVILSGAGILGASYAVARRVCAHHFSATGEPLEWLQCEFHLNGPTLQRIRALHEAYLPNCRQMCDRIAAKKKELQAALEAGPGVTPEVEQKLRELGTLRVQCQTQMLRHFYEVSQAMPPEEGRRYLAEMERLTLDFHGQFEQAMSPHASAPHGTH